MKYKINLLTIHKEKPLDRVIYFTLNYLRYILVITQIVVIGVFFYRFKVDQEIVDLQDTIDQKKEIVLVSQPMIKLAKQNSFKLGQVEDIVKKQKNFLNSIDYVLSIFPEKFLLSSFSLAEENISMTGTTQDISNVNLFLNRLRKEAKFSKIELQNITKKDAGFEFIFQLVGYKG
ncbi:hypothetical protein A2866_05380 [Candidatus Roizmanbacteria bacterium RIFCSPHIGHO2_01_FULL_39_8]|uniref:Fimbrial assembly protein n=3 Tax=Candidatus Roizmaniibacteriota TaxID=1752723 RepID=A0A1F7GUS1_9BACT|nr:MAG: hypothetical protein A2866_05380 [Candidatus Roizmanbacteria bacterium RIFCSPHIGHO2_01_FULL_39_8]OGK25544.1 MAG: hypothetical protein A3C28_01660 [Candidatus Roizmanbacteria bacterium RIFCSPHIGHO2_02_FULL_39_9]OGK35076.1 MAG: hypothetical protein A3F60_03260 [Candidatus Roizmanbacteria bacterium RIFCSPHIGHO2_12_FULL_39_8]